MRFLRKNKKNRTVLVISDLHLGAGHYVDGKVNFLEDFHHDKELVEFLQYYSEGDYSQHEVELIINGDFFDFLAVPFVPYFDDEFWSEDAAIDKLKMILSAHPEVMDAIDIFLSKKNKTITYIIGNHDGELAFPKVREYFINQLSNENKEHFKFYLDNEYEPVKGIIIKHGHEYEVAHQFDNYDSVVEDPNGKRFYIPPWGSYYVMRVINKFKEEKDYINQVRPIKSFIIYGLIFNTLFTLRFLFANAYYFIMVRFLQIYQSKLSLTEIFKNAMKELELFQDYEKLTRSFFDENDVKALIVGHTHESIFRTYPDGRIFVNTGTWTKMTHLDLSSNRPAVFLTYAQVEVSDYSQDQKEKFEHLDVNLNVWKGRRDLPYYSYS